MLGVHTVFAAECRRAIADSRVPCSRLTFAVVLPVVTAPGVRASMTATRLPPRASSTAVTNPVIPAPTTATSALGTSVAEVCGR